MAVTSRPQSRVRDPRRASWMASAVPKEPAPSTATGVAAGNGVETDAAAAFSVMTGSVATVVCRSAANAGYVPHGHFCHNYCFAPVAQWIELPPPKGKVGRSIRLRGATTFLRARRCACLQRPTTRLQSRRLLPVADHPSAVASMQRSEIEGNLCSPEICLGSAALRCIASKARKSC